MAFWDIWNTASFHETHTFITKISLNNSETGMREGCKLAFAC